MWLYRNCCFIKNTQNSLQYVPLCWICYHTEQYHNYLSNKIFLYIDLDFIMNNSTCCSKHSRRYNKTVAIVNNKKLVLNCVVILNGCHIEWQYKGFQKQLSLYWIGGYKEQQHKNCSQHLCHYSKTVAI